MQLIPWCIQSPLLFDKAQYRTLAAQPWHYHHPMFATSLWLRSKESKGSVWIGNRSQCNQSVSMITSCNPFSLPHRWDWGGSLHSYCHINNTQSKYQHSQHSKRLVCPTPNKVSFMVQKSKIDQEVDILQIMTISTFLILDLINNDINALVVHKCWQTIKTYLVESDGIIEFSITLVPFLFAMLTPQDDSIKLNQSVFMTLPTSIAQK